MTDLLFAKLEGNHEETAAQSLSAGLVDSVRASPLCDLYLAGDISVEVDAAVKKPFMMLGLKLVHKVFSPFLTLLPPSPPLFLCAWVARNMSSGVLAKEYGDWPRCDREIQPSVRVAAPSAPRQAGTGKGDAGVHQGQEDTHHAPVLLPQVPVLSLRGESALFLDDQCYR